MSVAPAEVRVLRGEVVESRHRVSIVVADASGRLVFACGESERTIPLRSAAKPFQAAAAVAAGALDAPGASATAGASDEELAIVAASHSGEPVHVETVRRILGKLGLDERALRCGAHPPLHAPSAVAVGNAAGPLHNNCSGKHAGMLALAHRLGEPPESYLDPDGATQQRVLEAVAAACGLAAGGVVRATDGCSAPTFAVPLRRAARAFACLARPDALAGALGTALRRVADAMVAAPWHVAGTGRFDTELLRAAGGRLVSKAGAEGVQGIADRESGLGLFLKVEDGAARAVAPAALAVLRELGWLPAGAFDALAAHGSPELRNHAGHVVGRIEATVPPVRPTSRGAV